MPAQAQTAAKTVMKLPKEDEAPKTLLRAPEGFLPIHQAPDEGKAVLVTDGRQECAGYLKHTRYFDKKGGKWRVTTIWSRRQIDGGGPLGFKPTGFKGLPDNYGFEPPKTQTSR